MKKPNAYLQIDVGMDTGFTCGWNPTVATARLMAFWRRRK